MNSLRTACELITKKLKQTLQYNEKITCITENIYFTKLPDKEDNY